MLVVWSFDWYDVLMMLFDAGSNTRVSLFEEYIITGYYFIYIHIYTMYLHNTIRTEFSIDRKLLFSSTG